MNDLMRTLVEAFGPSGFEDHIRELIRSEIEPFVDEITVDALGNLIARKQPPAAVENPVKVMVAAHMDEIGIMVTHITEKGYLRFTNIGGVYPHTLLGNRVLFANGVVGVIGSDRIDDLKVIHPLTKHYIDVGASGYDDVPVRVGDPASFVRELEIQGNRLVAKSMDDRVGCLVAIEALRRLPQEIACDLYVVFSVQEEVGTRGAETAANRILPDISIALDVTRTGDMPESRAMDVRLGDGPAIKVKDSGMIAHPGLVQLMRRRAEEIGIAYQMEVLEAGTTDARPMQIAGPGSVAGCISIPCRYIHTPSEMVDARDIEGAIKLLTSLLTNPLEI
jgi:tetrahedral aminopeptidase